MLPSDISYSLIGHFTHTHARTHTHGSLQSGLLLSLVGHHENFYATQTRGIYIATLLNTSSGIPNVSEGDLCGKTQHFMLACSVANIFRCDKSTVHRKKQLKLDDNMPKMIELTLK
jgi:hypothetical protein